MKYLYILIMMSALLGCNEDDAVVPPLDEVGDSQSFWELDERFTGINKVQFNSHSNKNRISFFGLDMYTSIELEDSIEQIELSIPNIGFDVNLKMSISNNVIVTIKNEYGSGVFCVYNLDRLIQTPLILDLSEIDTTFARFNSPDRYVSESIIANNKHQILIPYYSNIGTRLLQIKLMPNENPNSSGLQVESTKIYQLDFLHQVPNFIRYLKCIDDTFYISDSKNTYRLGPDGELLKVLDNVILGKIFMVDNNLYGVRQFSHNEIYISEDGITWKLTGLSGQSLGILTYTNTKHESIAYRMSQLWRISLSGDSLKMTELNNSGLEGNEITSVSEFNNNIYATTLSGVFKKPSDKLLMERNIENE